MRLPNASKAFVEARKLSDYLLSDQNSGGKSGLFIALGFTLENASLLRDALISHAQTHEVVRISESAHGKKYIIEGELLTPDGRSPQVRAVWIVDIGTTAPRLVTAYPLEGQYP